MKNRFYLFLMLFAVCAFAFQNTATAQEEEQQKEHIFVITTFKSVIPDGGSFAERDSLVMIWVNMVKQNDKIISMKNMTHFYGNDVRDWVVIMEYASWEDIAASWKIEDELTKEKFPDKMQRQAYYMKIWRYFPMHSDEILWNHHKMSK